MKTANETQKTAVVAAEEAAIRQVFAQLESAWNDGDADAFVQCMTDDCDYITFAGQHIKGREANRKIHEELFNSWALKGSLMRPGATPPTVVLLSPTVALMHSTGVIQLRFHKQPPASRQSIQTTVLIKTNCSWKVRAFHNCRIQQPGIFQRLLMSFGSKQSSSKTNKPMKTIAIVLITVLTFGLTSVWAQSEQYKQAMAQAIGDMQNTSQKSPTADILASANKFERIANAEPKEWLPRYYAGLNYVYLGFMGKDEAEKDKFLDQADVNLKAAEALSPANDELAVLKAYIAQARMVVDPTNRWQQYGPLFQAGIEKAKSLNPANPRPYALEGSSLMYTPEQFGGGPSTGCPVLKQAVEKFATFKPASELHPAWGQKNIEPLLAKCK
ncbi:hypothetical protein GCM10027341_03800 [Spirosoma knui]